METISSTYLGSLKNLVNIFGGLRKWPDMITSIIKVNEFPALGDDASPLKEILFRLGGLHTSMSFLASVGHLMTSSGLQTMLENVYTNWTAISRAVCGHLSVVAALHAIIMSEIYNSPIIMDNDEESNHPSDLLSPGR